MPGQCFVIVPATDGSVSDAEIYQVIADNIPAGVTAWTELSN
jgi:hypothetical protein